MLHSHNYIQSFKTAIESVRPGTPDFIIIHANKVLVGEHGGRYIAPSTNQVAVMLCWSNDGYTINDPQVDPVTGAPLYNVVSCMNYYCYPIMTIFNNFNPILRYGMLTNQCLVNQCAKIQSERFACIHNNQTKLQAENYDALQLNEHSSEIGQLIILPSSFMGGPKYLHEKTQEAMTFVRHHANLIFL
ncbi:hypothetical protein PR048_025169 [Dryococelus australis]|uniref:Helitron helicase-like domain-containing protein n=1 Tax=Dryococelus australis TaxID=614101 RepID=A0ABQ9GQM3_9NEOP|nr:hypothetical protein PR048_025169 [Dryococelus australis]